MAKVAILENAAGPVITHDVPTRGPVITHAALEHAAGPVITHDVPTRGPVITHAPPLLSPRPLPR